MLMLKVSKKTCFLMVDKHGVLTKNPKRFVAQQFNYTSAPAAAAAAAAAAAEAAAILQHVAYLCLFNLGEKKSP